MRQLALLLILSGLLETSVAQESIPSSGSGFASSQVVQGSTLPANSVTPGSTFLQGEVIFPPQNPGLPSQSLQNGLPNNMTQPPLVNERVAPQPVRESSVIERFYRDDLFHYTWIDFGEDQGLRIHRIEMTNAWADMRAANFFSRPIDSIDHRFDAGVSFGVQWWKELPATPPPPTGPYLPPVLYDLYADFGWRTAITPIWMIDLALSPGLSTDFRVTPPDGFRMKGHALTMVDMLPNLRGVLGIWYVNLDSVKILPVAGLCWQASDATRIEAVFPQPRIIQSLGCWRGNNWEMSLGGEFGGFTWAFKNPGNDRETIDYRDLRLLFGLSSNGKKGQATLEAGYVFSRELRYGTQQAFDFNPGNAWMVRLGWDF